MISPGAARPPGLGDTDSDLDSGDGRESESVARAFEATSLSHAAAARSGQKRAATESTRPRRRSVIIMIAEFQVRLSPGAGPWHRDPAGPGTAPVVTDSGGRWPRPPPLTVSVTAASDRRRGPMTRLPSPGGIDVPVRPPPGELSHVHGGTSDVGSGKLSSARHASAGLA